MSSRMVESTSVVAITAATDVARTGPDRRRFRRLRGGADPRSITDADQRNDSPSDELADLVADARDGDRSAYDALVRRTWSDTYALAFRLTGNDEDARDVCQEAYLRAYRGLRRFRGDARFTTWLFRITANCASNQLGRRRRHRHEELPDEDASVDLTPAHDPAGRAETAQLRERVQAALAALPPRLRSVVVLRDIYDLSHESIAAELGISESAAKVRLHRARRRLRDDVFLRAEVEGRSADAGHDTDHGTDLRAV